MAKAEENRAEKIRSLAEVRQDINKTDEEMARLFEQRMKLAAEVAAYKKANSLPIYDAQREEQVLQNGMQRIDDTELQSYYFGFQKNLMELSRRYQSRLLSGLRVAYCGTEGAFAHIAASKIFPTSEKVAFGSFKKAYEAVENGDCNCAVLPVENSFAGDVDQVNDLMFFGTLFVNGMYDLAVTHDLLGLEGTTLSDVKTVVTHPQALSQCSSFIKEHGLKEVEYSNTALAAAFVKEKNDRSTAAIASAETAERMGLSVIARSINDDRSNTTRFAVFSRVDSRAADHGVKPFFSLLFTARNEAGSLAEALSIIGRHGFNMRTLRSRPMKELLWQYYFYVEAEGDIYGEEGIRCIEEMKHCCDRIKIVGSYQNLNDCGKEEQK